MQTSLVFEGAFSLGASQRSKWWDNQTGYVPAPQNTYNLPNFQDREAAPKWSVPKGKRSNLEDLRGFPEPGKYLDDKQINQTANDHKYRQISMKQRYMSQDSTKSAQISPFSYEPKDRIAKKNLPLYSFGYRFTQEVEEVSPGPAQYPRPETELERSRTMQEIARRREEELQKTWERKGKSFDDKKARTFTSSFGTQPRLKGHTSPAPGAGTYDQHVRNVRRSPSWKFGDQEKIYGPTGDNNPGPGSYDPKGVTQKNSGFSLGSKNNANLKQSEKNFPGPGTYSPPVPQDVKNVRIGTAPKGDLVERESLLKPAPGAYDQTVQPKQISFLKTASIGFSERPPLTQLESTPGAGTYELPSKVVEGPKWSMAAKLKEKKKLNVGFPGSGAYDPIFEAVKERPNEFSVGKSQRSNPVRSKFYQTGPGSYDVNGNVADGKKYSIGAGNRFNALKNTYEPGPGSYDIGGTIGKIPNYLLLAKRKNQGLLDFQ